ncbi:CinA family nicotinamide mononucleotide deamidase-related protein [Corallincola platygyrae]|uniref:CinA-like protein n=1 Tax=Corallincola platygyrae TaxID=1193278 RepID=A0ABW4XKY7_9GAMM
MTRIVMISTGDEVLQGDIVDTNAAWLSQQLNENGLQMSWRLTVADELSDLSRAFSEASQYADWIIVNGGLGPTSDDLSAEAAANALGEPLKEFTSWIDVLLERYQSRGRVMPESNRKQALLPVSAVLIDNPVGSACGFVIELNGARLLFTPGVPSEFKLMVKEQILPRILDAVEVTPPAMYRWLTFGLSESRLNDFLGKIELLEGMTLGYRSAMPSIEVKLKVVQGIEQQTVEHVISQIVDALGDNLFCHHNKGFAAEIQSLMLSREASLALAESCTGGMLASELVALAGSSAYFQRGYVTYSNEAKQQDINVPAQILEQYGAVSEQVAIAMAEGARAKAGTDYALSITGIAGPDGGTEEKPVGTVGFALATPDRTYSQLLRLPNRGRGLVRSVAAAMAMDMLRRYLIGKPVFGEYEFIKRVSSA